MGFLVSTAVQVQILVSWVLTPCSPVGGGVSKEHAAPIYMAEMSCDNNGKDIFQISVRTN
jgi:hypothetical protein